MKKIVCFILTVSLAITIFLVSAESSDLYLLWDIPFGTSAGDVKQYVELYKGMKCSRTTHAPTALTPSYESIESENDSDLFLYGYPFHFEFTEIPEAFTLTFNISGSINELKDAADMLLSGLKNKYGAPDSAYLDDGQSDASGRRILKDITAEDKSPSAMISDAMKSGTSSDAISLYIRFKNIIFQCSVADPQIITIRFGNNSEDLFGLPGSDTF